MALCRAGTLNASATSNTQKRKYDPPQMCGHLWLGTLERRLRHVRRSGVYQFTCPTWTRSIMVSACVRALASVESGVSERCTSLPFLRIAQW